MLHLMPPSEGATVPADDGTIMNTELVELWAYFVYRQLPQQWRSLNEAFDNKTHVL